MFSDCSVVDNEWCASKQRLAYHGGWFELVFAGAHFHVGGLSMELFNADTGQLICRNQAVYGGSDAPRDEEGYVVAIPPCVWGGGAGAPAPLRLHSSTRLRSVARYNSSMAHSGVMAFWMGRGVFPLLPQPEGGPLPLAH